jgi:hypothetical protein
MPIRASIFVFLITLASCRLIDDKPNPCFACSVAGKDSCQMTDNYTLFTADRPDSTATIRFSRCGAGLLSTVRFRYSGKSTGDSALVSILVDSSATHDFPLTLPDGELPLAGGIAFNQSCIVSFILRSSRKDTIKNIFLHWAPKAPGAASANASTPQ